VRLASILTGWDIDILTEAEESERRQEEFKTRSRTFIDSLDIDDVIAHLLVAEGFSTVDEIAYSPLEDLVSIEGFDEDIAEELQNRALVFAEAERTRLQDQTKELGVAEDLLAFEGLTLAHVAKLAEQGVKTLDDLADLAGDELIEMLPDAGFDQDAANGVIMAARAHWFEDEEGDEPDAGAEDAAGEAHDETPAT